MKLLTTFFKRSRKEKVLIVEAFFLLGWNRLYILLVPFQIIAKHLERNNHRPESPNDFNKSELPIKIGSIITSVAAHTPWESKCLIQSLTAYTMLKRRGFCCDLYLGVSKDDSGKMIAHAWTMCGETGITGATIKDQFTVTYQVPPRRG